MLALVVACASGNADAPALTVEAEARLSARGLAVACDQDCVGTVVYVRDLVYESMNPPTPGDPLSDSQRMAISEQFGEVQFVNEREVEAIYAEGGVVFVVGPIRKLSNGLVEVEVSSEGVDSIDTQVLPFAWNGRDWVPSRGGE